MAWKLYDGNNVSLGTVISAGGGTIAGRENVTIVTSTGHVTTVNWDGTFPAGQVYFTGYSAGPPAVCSGAAYLNSGTSSASRPMFGKLLVWVASMNSFMVPTTMLANGTAISIKPSLSGFTIAGFDNPACGPSTSDQYMWPLTIISNSAAGLPATIATPLRFQ